MAPQRAVEMGLGGIFVLLGCMHPSAPLVDGFTSRTSLHGTHLSRLAMNTCSDPKAPGDACRDALHKVASCASIACVANLATATQASAENNLDPSDYNKSPLNRPSDDFWYPPFMIGKWNTSMTFLGGKFTNKVSLDQMAKDGNLPGFGKYSVAFLPQMGKDLSNVTLRYVQLDAHPREDHPFNIRSLITAALPDAVVESAAYSFQKAPTWIYSEANKWTIKYRDSEGRGVIDLSTRKRSSRVFAGTVETIEFFTQTHTRTEAGREKVTVGDYAVNWKLSVPASQKDEFITVKDLSKSQLILGTVDVLSFFRPSNDLYFKVPKEAAAVFTYNVTMERIGDVKESTSSTIYPFVWRDQGPIELNEYFGY